MATFGKSLQMVAANQTKWPYDWKVETSRVWGKGLEYDLITNGQ